MSLLNQRLSWLAWAYGAAGRRDQALKVIGELDERARSEHVSAMFFAWAYGGLGDADQTFVWLDKALEERSSQIAHVGSLPLLAIVQSKPKFDDVLRRLKLPHPKP